MKKEIILENLIKTYLNDLNPISSAELKKRCDLSFSPSTIRNYFQKLDGEGMIIKVHISSGSIPSTKALKNYWLNYFDFDNIDIKNDLHKIAKQFDVFIATKKHQNLYLKDIINVNNKFIILDFETKEVVLRYTKELFQLFVELEGYEISNIKKILNAINLELIDKFNIQDYKNYNKEFLYKHNKFDIDKLLSVDAFEYIKKGLSFIDDSLIYKTNAIINNTKHEFIIIGDIYKDYTKIFNHLKEA